jgi:hypothetical protein
VPGERLASVTPPTDVAFFQTAKNRRPAQQVKVNHPPRVTRQNELTPIRTLRHVMRNIHDHYPR